MKLRTLIVDDEPRARSRMRRLLSAHPDVEIVGEAADGDATVAQVLTLRPQVLFLDVDMPTKSGIEAVRAIHATVPETQRPLVIFTTAHEEHAIEAFALEGTDYLLKPIERARLDASLRRIRKIIWAKAPNTAIEPPVEERISGWKRGNIVPIELSDLAAVVVEDTISFGHTPTGKIEIRMAVGELEEKLPDDRFCRVSRSAILQLDWLEALVPGESGTYSARMKSPIALEVPVSRRRARKLKELLTL